MQANQRGDEIEETVLSQYWPDDVTDDQMRQVVFGLLEHLKLEAVRTNATKHGDTQVVIRPIEE